MATKKSGSRSKRSGSSSSKKRSSSKKSSGSAAGNSRNPSQENKGKVGDEGHAGTRPSETRSVVEREDRGNGGQPRPEYPDYSVVDPKKIEGGPDVLIDVPVVKVDEIDLEVDDLHAQVAVLAEVRKPRP